MGWLLKGFDGALVRPGGGGDASSEKMIYCEMPLTLLSGNRHTYMSYKVTSETIPTGGKIQSVLNEELGF